LVKKVYLHLTRKRRPVPLGENEWILGHCLVAVICCYPWSCTPKKQNDALSACMSAKDLNINHKGPPQGTKHISSRLATNHHPVAQISYRQSWTWRKASRPQC
jgi:hypothetical protein